MPHAISETTLHNLLECVSSIDRTLLSLIDSCSCDTDNAALFGRCKIECDTLLRFLANIGDPHWRILERRMEKLEKKRGRGRRTRSSSPRRGKRSVVKSLSFELNTAPGTSAPSTPSTPYTPLPPVSPNGRPAASAHSTVATQTTPVEVRNGAPKVMNWNIPPVFNYEAACCGSVKQAVSLNQSIDDVDLTTSTNEYTRPIEDKCDGLERNFVNLDYRLPSASDDNVSHYTDRVIFLSRGTHSTNSFNDHYNSVSEYSYERLGDKLDSIEGRVTALVGTVQQWSNHNSTCKSTSDLKTDVNQLCSELGSLLQSLAGNQRAKTALDQIQNALNAMQVQPESQPRSDQSSCAATVSFTRLSQDSL